jgi:hypothetical protein
VAGIRQSPAPGLARFLPRRGQARLRGARLITCERRRSHRGPASFSRCGHRAPARRDRNGRGGRSRRTRCRSGPPDVVAGMPDVRAGSIERLSSSTGTAGMPAARAARIPCTRPPHADPSRGRSSSRSTGADGARLSKARDGEPIVGQPGTSAMPWRASMSAVDAPRTPGEGVRSAMLRQGRTCSTSGAAPPAPRLPETRRERGGTARPRSRYQLI